MTTKPESPKRSAVSWLNRVEFHLRQFRNDASSSDVLALTAAINEVKRILRTFRKHRSRKSSEPKYTKPLESSFRARTVQYKQPNVVERLNPSERKAA